MKDGMKDGMKCSIKASFQTVWLRTIATLMVLGIALAAGAVRADDTEEFFIATKIDNDRTVRQLLVAGFDPNTQDPKGDIALVLAIKEDAPKVATALLAHPKIQVDAANKAGETALMMAALRGNEEWLRRLISSGAQVNRTGWTPLHYAASGGATHLVALLLDKGADIEAPSPNGTTALMMAARYGAQDSAVLLVARGAKVRAKNLAGLDAVEFARGAGRDKLVKQLEQVAP
jgi:uncharacterized protein